MQMSTTERIWKERVGEIHRVVTGRLLGDSHGDGRWLCVGEIEALPSADFGEP